MNLEILAYPFLFVAMYFEVFLLITLLSAPARAARGRPLLAEETLPSVAVVVPCFNEAGTIGDTVESLLGLRYPKERLSLILVDDGSTDDTLRELRRFERHSQVTVLQKENGGKHTALNAGIAAAPYAEFIACLDADSLVAPDSLRYVVSCFRHPQVAAATGSLSIHEPRGLLGHLQYGEYFFSITLRHIISSINGLYVTPGPLSVYRRSVIQEVGGFRHGHQTEDMEMALRIQRAGYRIENALLARVFTKAPRTLRSLLRQRIRWTSGFLRNMTGEYRDLLWNPRFGVLGLLVLPLGLVSVAGGILLFCLAIWTLIRRMADFYVLSSGIPLDYALVPQSLDIFYAPASATLLLALIAVTVALGFIVLGKRLSRTKGPIRYGLAAYALCYGIIAPLWLMRAAADVATGTHRTWR